MNGRARHGTNRMERIAALLLSLAGLAEHVATRSAPIRLIVLWLLRQAESVAAGFVAATDPDAIHWEERFARASDRAGYDPMDALALALSLRLLALVVQAMAQDAARLPDEAEISACMDRIGRIVLIIMPAAPPIVELRDTS